MRYKVQYRAIGGHTWSKWASNSYGGAPFQPDVGRRYTFPDFIQAHKWAEYAQSERIRLGRQASTPIEWQVVEAHEVM